MKSEAPDNMQTFLLEIKEMLAQARQKAYAAINFAMVETYWHIGRRIVEEEQQGKQRADYATYLIRELSKNLTAEFGKGFALANLKNFRQFYLTFPEYEKGYTLGSQLTWSHYRLIMRVDNPAAREYYIREAAEQHWSTRQLERKTEKNETIVKYSVMNDIPQLFAAKYKLYLPSEEELIAEIEREKLLLNLKNDEL